MQIELSARKQYNRFEVGTMLRSLLAIQRRIRWRDALARYARDARGNFAIMFAFAAPVLIVFIGMGIDYKTALSDKSRMDTAADAAAIAAVNTAKAYFAANSASLSGSALSNAAIAAGIAQGEKVFAADMGPTLLVTPVTPGLTMTYSNLTFNSSVTWSGQVGTHFGGWVGITNIAISGASAATAALPKYLDFYVVVDASGSMGIPTSSIDQQTLIANNPDNAIEEANGYVGGCQFACHFAGYQGYNWAAANGISLKLNSVSAAVQSLLSTAASTAIISNQFRVGIYPFIVDAIAAAPLSASYGNGSQVYNVAYNLGTYLDAGTTVSGVTNGGMGSGGTHFENLWGDMNPNMNAAGTGFSSSSTLPFIILVTDGVDNSQTYPPFTGSYPQTPSTTFCTNAKNAGYTVAVLLIPYVPIVDPETIWNDEDGVVNNLINTNSITPVMQSCASSGYFFQAATAAEINSAMLQIFYQAVGSARLTQ